RNPESVGFIFNPLDTTSFEELIPEFLYLALFRQAAFIVRATSDPASPVSDMDGGKYSIIFDIMGGIRIWKKHNEKFMGPSILKLADKSLGKDLFDLCERELGKLHFLGLPQLLLSSRDKRRTGLSELEMFNLLFQRGDVPPSIRFFEF
ncbi:MAG: hypothetical protein ACFFE4_21520, partial [Candidatus Thorarchaeota archaeon]